MNWIARVIVSTLTLAPSFHVRAPTSFGTARLAPGIICVSRLRYCSASWRATPETRRPTIVPARNRSQVSRTLPSVVKWSRWPTVRYQPHVRREVQPAQPVGRNFPGDYRSHRATPQPLAVYHRHASQNSLARSENTRGTSVTARQREQSGRASGEYHTERFEGGDT